MRCSSFCRPAPLLMRRLDQEAAAMMSISPGMNARHAGGYFSREDYYLTRIFCRRAVWVFPALKKQDHQAVTDL